MYENLCLSPHVTVNCVVVLLLGHAACWDLPLLHGSVVLGRSLPRAWQRILQG